MDKVKKLLQSAAKSPQTLQTLKTSPEKLKGQFALSDDDVESLKSADVLLVVVRDIGIKAMRRRSTTTYTFTTGSTISP
jgi:hypothetical protein